MQQTLRHYTDGCNIILGASEDETRKVADLAWSLKHLREVLTQNERVVLRIVQPIDNCMRLSVESYLILMCEEHSQECIHIGSDYLWEGLVEISKVELEFEVIKLLIQRQSHLVVYLQVLGDLINIHDVVSAVNYNEIVESVKIDQVGEYDFSSQN